MKSMVKNLGEITLPEITGEFAMIPFDCQTFEGLTGEFLEVAKAMMKGVVAKGTAYFTIHGKSLKAGQTLRRGGPHTDGNYEPHVMDFGGGGWKVGQDGPAINTALHHEQYNNERGGIILATNYTSAIGYVGEFDGLPNTGGNCSHIQLNNPFPLEAGYVWYGNNHFIHESLPVNDNVHRVMARITLPMTHVYN